MLGLWLLETVGVPSPGLRFPRPAIVQPFHLICGNIATLALPSISNNINATAPSSSSSLRPIDPDVRPALSLASPRSSPTSDSDSSSSSSRTSNRNRNAINPL